MSRNPTEMYSATAAYTSANRPRRARAGASMAGLVPPSVIRPGRMPRSFRRVTPEQ